MNIEEAEYASDIISEDDYDTVTGDLGIVIRRASHAPLTRAQANDLRAAYLGGTPGPNGTGWAAMRTAWVAIDSRAGAWLDAMTTVERNGLIYLISSRSARPTPPPV